MFILTINLLFTTLAFAIAAKLYVLPKIRELEPRTILVPILILHSLRNLGLMFLEPGAVSAGMPPGFAYPAALGDFLAAILALIAIPAVVMRTRYARPLVWIFSIEGTLDLLLAIVLANIYDVAQFMGPAYWIPAFWVPALLVTHYVTFVVLLRGRWTAASSTSPRAAGLRPGA